MLVFFIFMPGVAMVMKTTAYLVAVLGAVGTVGMRKDMIMLMGMLMGVAVDLLAVAVRVLVKMLMQVTVLMLVLQGQDLPRTVALIAERQQIERLQVLIREKISR